jgi:hypothetical protein
MKLGLNFELKLPLYETEDIEIDEEIEDTLL